MCTEKFTLKTIDELQAILAPFHDALISIAQDEEGCTDLRAVVIDELRPIGDILVLALERLTNLLDDDKVKKSIRDRLAARLNNAIDRAEAMYEEKHGHKAPPSSEAVPSISPDFDLETLLRVVLGEDPTMN